MEKLSFESTVELGHGVRMPILGFGTYKAVGDDAYLPVAQALEIGYRLIDTASLYENEEAVGRAIRDSGIGRDEIFVTTKVWNEEQGFDGTRAACERSLTRLGLERVDLYLVHWPMPDTLESTWRAMESLLAEGKTRAIGVCNHLPDHLLTLLEFAEVPPAVDQVEFHPWLQQPDLQAFTAEHDIVLQAWAPIMRGRAGEVPELVEIAKRHGVTPSQVAIRWVLEQGYSAIPKSVHEERIAENADVFGFELTEDEQRTIAALDRGERLGRHPDSWSQP